MQTYVRRWLAVRELERRQLDVIEKRKWEEEQRRIRKRHDTDLLRELQRRKNNPMNAEDFLLLFSDLQSKHKSLFIL